MGASDVLLPANFKFTRLFNTGTKFYFKIIMSP